MPKTYISVIDLFNVLRKALVLSLHHHVILVEADEQLHDAGPHHIAYSERSARPRSNVYFEMIQLVWIMWVFVADVMQILGISTNQRDSI